MAINVGDTVRLTSKFLRNTGSTEGRKTWVVTGFDSNIKDWAITDEKADTSIFTAKELTADPTLAYRRIAVIHLRKV